MNRDQTAAMRPRPSFPVVRNPPDSVGRRILDGLLNLLYPEECFLCAAPLARLRDRGICRECWDKALALEIRPPFCACCGLPLPHFGEDAKPLCGRCLLQMPPFAGARSFGYYTAEIAGIIRAFKFLGRRNLTDLLAPLLARVFQDHWSSEAFDLVVPVPLHAGRKRERGYNQSELLARSFSRLTAVPYSKKVLVRTRPTLPQVGLSNARRLENVRGAFQCPNPERAAGKRILLMDDVMTTGATAASASQALLDAGALRVSVLTAARAVR